MSLNDTPVVIMESLIKEYPGLFYVDAVWIGLVFIAGVIGNSLALCAVATTPSLRTATDFHITILAAVDLFIMAVLAPCRIAMEYFSGRWPRHEGSCRLLAYLMPIAFALSLQQLALVANNRFLRVTRSHAVYRKFTSKPFLVGQRLLFAGFVCMLTLLPLYSGFGSMGYNHNVHFCFFTGRNQQVFVGYSMFIALVIIPLFYGGTFRHVRAHQRRVAGWRGEDVGTRRVRPDGSCSRPGTNIGTDRGVSPAPGRYDSRPEGEAREEVANPVALDYYQGENNREMFVLSRQTIECEATDVPSQGGVSVPAAEESGRPVTAPVVGAPRRSNPQHGPMSESVKITKKLLLIFCAYICCWLPWWVLSLTELYVMDIPIPLYHVINNMLWTNSCINPYLYASMSRNYRKAIKRCLRIKCFIKRRPEQ